MYEASFIYCGLTDQTLTLRQQTKLTLQHTLQRTCRHTAGSRDDGARMLQPAISTDCVAINRQAQKGLGRGSSRSLGLAKG